MAYQTINPYTEELVKSFSEHTDAQLEAIIAKRRNRVRKRLESKNRSRNARRSSRRPPRFFVKSSTNLQSPSRSRWANLFREAQGGGQAERGHTGLLCRQRRNLSGAPQAQRSRKARLSWRANRWACCSASSLGIFPTTNWRGSPVPNLMAGNVLIVKHAPNVPQCALAFEKLFLDAGAPEGVYTNVFLSNEQAAKTVADPRIKGVALTGSERAGSAVAAEAGQALKKTTMELGGSDAFIVLDDADLDTAVKWGVWGRMNNTGQCCVAAKRFVLHEDIADAFLERFKKELEALVPGDPMDPKTTLGPLCTKGALDLW